MEYGIFPLIFAASCDSFGSGSTGLGFTKGRYLMSSCAKPKE